MASTPPFAVFLVCLCTLFTSVGQFFLKLGTDYIEDDLIRIFNIFLVFGFVLYGFGGLLLIYSLKEGELSTIYPLLSLSFVWVFLLSQFVLDENISITNWLGLALIVFGAFLIGNTKLEIKTD